MSPGFFSWRPFSQPRSKTGSKKEKADSTLAQSVAKIQDAEETQVVVRSGNLVHTLDDILLPFYAYELYSVCTWGQESSIDANVGSPTTIAASAKELLSVLESPAGIIPDPLLKESIGVALNIIRLCEEVSALEQKVKKLQAMVGRLMVVIVDNVTSKTEDEIQEMVVEAAKTISELDVQGLLGTLGTIDGDLTDAVVLYKEVNMNTPQDRMDRLSIALERFKLANDLRLFREVSSLLRKMEDKVDNIAVIVDDIAHKVDKLAETFQELYKRIQQDGVARDEIPLKPGVFYGRTEVVEEITQLLINEETSRVCILGPCAMGKTSISLAVAESPLIQNRFSDNVVWVPCIGATSRGLFLETLYVQLQVPGDRQVTLQKIISYLSTSVERRLLIFDNFETPLIASESAPATQTDFVEEILLKIAKLKHIAILVTMCGNLPPCYYSIEWQTKDVQPTDEEANMKIFHTINPSSKGDPDVRQLLQILGQMPFAVTLMATLAKESRSTPKELLESWAEAGPDILSDDGEQSMKHRIRLSVDSDLVQQNPNAVILLSVLSLLPMGTTKENLRWWAPMLKKSMVPSALYTLFMAGLLVEYKSQDSDTPVLFVIPVVQSFMQHRRIGDDLQQQILLSCCQFILDHASRFLDPSFPSNSKALLSEDSNIQAILLRSPPSQDTSFFEKHMEALISYCWHRCDTKPSLDMVNFALSAARASGNEKYIAMLLWCLGRTYYQLGSYHQSYEHLQEGFQLLNKVSSQDPKSQPLCGQCGLDLNDTARMVIQDPEKLVR